MKQAMRKTRLLAAGIMVGLISVAGCGNPNQSMVNSSQEARVEEALAAPAGYLVFSPLTAMQVATKKVKVDKNNTMVQMDNTEELHTLMVQEEFQFNKSKQISIKFNSYKSDEDDFVQVKQAQFSVEKNSIDTQCLSEANREISLTRNGINIRMQVVTGTKLEHIVVAFGPSDLKFGPAAKLRLQLVGDLTGVFSEGQAIGYHISGNDDSGTDTPEGTITKVSIEVDELDKFGCVLNIEVPGFSRYVIDD
ncbi:MAG: hypothetical protein O3B73_04040 [bacterium]|nr:hypothetical protein [bacterium]